ncbi:MAG: PIN domain-containing protein [Clostridia bacterium]|nr:PIN domain-containing protein [Clostridia bacterium]
MRLALDTNVIAALLNGEPYAEAVAEVLEGQRRELLLICGQVYAELLVAYPEPDLAAFLEDTGIEVDFAMPREAWRAAAEAWRRYLKKRKSLQAVYVCPLCGEQSTFRCSRCGRALPGPKTLLADFVVGAHALYRADRLFTLERRGRFYKTYFPSLNVLFI